MSPSSTYPIRFRSQHSKDLCTNLICTVQQPHVVERRKVTHSRIEGKGNLCGSLITRQYFTFDNLFSFEKISGIPLSYLPYNSQSNYKKYTFFFLTQKPKPEPPTTTSKHLKPSPLIKTFVRYSSYCYKQGEKSQINNATILNNTLRYNVGTHRKTIAAL